MSGSSTARMTYFSWLETKVGAQRVVTSGDDGRPAINLTPVEHVQRCLEIPEAVLAGDSRPTLVYFHWPHDATANGKLSDMRIEDFASRDRVRFATTVGLEYRTTEKQVRQVVSGIETMLRAMPRVWPDVVVAKLAAFSPSSLDVEVLCWFVTTDFDEYRRLRQDALLGILRVVEEAGTSIAFPTRTVLVAGADGRPPATPPARPQRAE